MFGLFGKSFGSEMSDYDRDAKRLGPKIVEAIQSYDFNAQQVILDEMNQLNGKRIECCKRHGRLEDMQRWMAVAEDGKQLRG